MEKMEVLRKALRLAGKYCRDNIPATFPNDPRFSSIIAGGNIRDPEGTEYIALFLQDSLKQLEEENECLKGDE